MRLCEGNNSADTKISEEGGGGSALVNAAESFPLQPCPGFGQDRVNFHRTPGRGTAGGWG